MMPAPLPKLEEDLASIVLIGSFNPVIFQPAWFTAKNLIREAEATAATVEMIHPEVTSFKVGWLSLNVTRERFVAMSSDAAQHIALRDLVLGTFHLLEHTPTSRIGMNRTMHFSLHQEQVWHRLGHMLAPKAPWENISVDPGLLSLVIQSRRSDQIPGRVVFRVEPSVKYKFGAFIDVNNEFVGKHDASTAEAPPAIARSDTTSELMELVRRHWDETIQTSLTKAQKLLERIPGEGNV